MRRTRQRRRGRIGWRDFEEAERQTEEGGQKRAGLLPYRISSMRAEGKQLTEERERTIKGQAPTERGRVRRQIGAQKKKAGHHLSRLRYEVYADALFSSLG